MLTLEAFKLNKGEEGSASLKAGETRKLPPITEFGVNAYTEEEERSLSEIIESFNERHGTQFSREDFLRFERVTRDVMDEEMTEMVRNNPADVVYNAFSQAFFQGMVRMFQNDREMQSIVMRDPAAREQATRHFFKRAQRQALEG
jgi:type I restriction enzyme R subunit